MNSLRILSDLVKQLDYLEKKSGLEVPNLNQWVPARTLAKQALAAHSEMTSLVKSEELQAGRLSPYPRMENGKYVITLTPEAANTLRTICGSITGQSPVRRAMNEIWNQLRMFSELVVDTEFFERYVFSSTTRSRITRLSGSWCVRSRRE